MSNIATISESKIIAMIHILRDEKVILDSDLAALYDVETKVLKQAVRRNIKRFPSDFMFELTKAEYDSLRSQFVTLKRGEHSKYLPFAFTEQGVAMLSSVLNSDRAIEVNIAIMRTFVYVRKMLDANKDLAKRVEKIEETHGAIIATIKQLMLPEVKPKRKIGFTEEGKKK